MDSKEFKELIDCIRDSLEYSIIGLNIQQITQLKQRLDSDALNVAIAVEALFMKKAEQCSN